MSGRTIFESNLETLAVELIERNPNGYLSEIEIVWPRAIAIQVPDSSYLDTPKAIIRSIYQEARAFEIAYRIVKDVCIPLSPPASAPTKEVEAI